MDDFVQVAYYARAVHLHGTGQEGRDLKALRALGYQVVDRGGSVEGRVQPIAVDINPAQMARTMNQCQVLMFRAFPDGSIPAGVANEIQCAMTHEVPVLEFPVRMGSRFLDMHATNAFLSQSGYF